MSKGTPRYLIDAIENGVEHSIKTIPADQMKLCIAAHVRDLLAHKFMIAFGRAESDNELLRLRQLFDEIVKIKEGQ